MIGGWINDSGSAVPGARSSQRQRASQSMRWSRRIFRYVDHVPVITRNERRNQYTSNTSTPSATASAPYDANRNGIHAGASSSTQVTRPGAASSSRSPTWRTPEGVPGASAGDEEDTSFPIIGLRNS